MKTKSKSNKEKRILFVCRYNRFRSRIAEAYFKKINKNKNIEVKSAGLIQGSPLNPKTNAIIKELGLNISGKPQGLSSKLMAWQNITVNVADDVPKQVFDRNIKYRKKVINWKIKDVTSVNKKQIIKVANLVIKKTDSFAKSIGAN